MIDFSHWLKDSEQEYLQKTANWRWVASLNGEGIAAPIVHPRHQKWIRQENHIHRPAMREVMFCLRGDSVYGFNGAVHRILPATVFLFDRHESRDWVSAPYQKDYETLWLHFDRQNAFRYNTFGLDVRQRPRRALSSRSKTGDLPCLIMDAWDRCIEEPREPLCWPLLKAALTAALLEILGTARQDGISNPHQEVIVSVQEYIRKHPEEELGLKHLARIAGYSPFFVHRLFVLYTGQTPHRYVQQVRLERGKELLRLNYTLEAIAGMIGMQHSSHFSRFFKQQMQCTPGEWRKRASEERG